MLTAFAILGVLAALFLAAALATRDSEGLAPAAPDVADLALPEGPLAGDDVRALRFGLAPRGYRMSEVDAVLERVAADLEARDRRIAELESATSPAPAASVPDVAVTATEPAPAPASSSAEDVVAPPVPVAVTPVGDVPLPAAAAEPAPAAPATDAAFSAVDDLDFPEVGLPDVDDEAPLGPDLSVGEVPVEPVDPPLRSS